MDKSQKSNTDPRALFLEPNVFRNNRFNDSAVVSLDRIVSAKETEAKQMFKSLST